ncbi:CoF synthetase [Gordonia sp. CPCC 206044]|uniref:CoF synthetase n=1 Tax=Gordonia sp. CPCC 206044 TaxID=3140793 RepID=UPI003AF3B4DB
MGPNDPAREQDSGTLAIPEYDAGSSVVLTDAQRWPTLTDTGRRRLDALRTHPHGPTWTHRAGDRLTAEAVARVQNSAAPPDEHWLADHLVTARGLPVYRSIRRRLRTLDDFPAVDRTDLMADIAAFVPYDADLEQMIHGSSSGSTGHALALPDDIEDTARTFWFMLMRVRALGIDWQPDPARMALAHIVFQRQAFTYASVISTFDQMTMARINLEPRSWPDRDDFLLDVSPQVFSGTPAALEALLSPRLVDGLRPLALFSGATELAPGLRADLEAAFGVPVIDVYSLHETRPIAISTDGGPFTVVDRKVFVEVLTDHGPTTDDGVYGEILVTAGENPLLPLVRYRTGDFGRLITIGGRRAITDLEAREDTRFLASDGRIVPNVDLTQQLQRSGARGWTVHQEQDGSLDVVVVGSDATLVEATLGALLHQPLRVRTVASVADLGPGKPRRHRSDAT